MKTAAAVALLLIAVTAVYLVSKWLRPRPNVVLITIDTQRPDRLGCYGHPTNRTPTIDRLAREGTLFENAYCDIPWTTGSMSSVMTGSYSSRHGVSLPIHRLGQSAITLAEVLHDRGYQTDAVVGSFPLDSIYGLDQGFDAYDDDFSRPLIAVPDQPIEHVESRFVEDPAEQAKFNNEKFINDAYRPDEDVTDAAIRTLQRIDVQHPFFLWVHYFGPHEKYEGGIGFHEQEPRIIAEYDGDVEAADHAVGRFLDALQAAGQLDRSIVVLHADHGQSLGDHDYVGHGLDLYDVSVRIPLIVRYPRTFPKGSRRADLVSNVDIMPTILDVLGLPAPPSVTGRSLVPNRRDQRHADYFETDTPTLVPVVTTMPLVGSVLGPTTMRGIRTPEWTLIIKRVVGPCSRGTGYERDAMGAPQLTDAVDVPLAQCQGLTTSELYKAGTPQEPRFNVVFSEPATTDALKARVAELSGADPNAREQFTLSPTQERKLKSLGYLQ